MIDLLVNKAGPKSGGRAGSFSLVSGWIAFDFLDDEKNVLGSWLEGIKRLVEVVSPAYGYVNSMAVENWDTPLNLQLRLPDISPISIYGREYVELLGAKEIEAAPFLEIEKVGVCYWLVASHSLRSGVPKGRRKEIREYFGEDAFMADGNWKYSTGRAPKFDLSASIAI